MSDNIHDPHPGQIRDIARLPYRDRQIICVESGTGPTIPRWVIVTGATAVAAVTAASAGLPVVVSGVAAGVASNKLLPRKRNRKPTLKGPARRKVLPISPAEAEPLLFPIGHSLRNYVYVGHPLIPERYLLITDFHRRLLEHKFVELLRIIAALGAVHTEVQVVEGSLQSLGAGSKVDIDTLTTGAGFGFGLGVDRAQMRSLVFTAISPANRGSAFPRDLAWLEEEVLWQQLIRQRIENSLQSIDFELYYTDDFGITADLTSMLTTAGFSIGGNFQEKQDVRWIVRATFNP